MKFGKWRIKKIVNETKELLEIVGIRDQGVKDLERSDLGRGTQNSPEQRRQARMSDLKKKISRIGEMKSPPCVRASTGSG